MPTEQMAYIGLRWVTLSGGEPLTRRDWPQLVKHLTERGVSCNMITNGWLITDDVARQATQDGEYQQAAQMGDPDAAKELEALKYERRYH